MAFSWLQGLDPRPSFPAYSGPYIVGSTDVEIPVDSLPDGVQRPDPSVTTVAFRIYYPCDTPGDNVKSQPPVYWISAPQREILSGYARFCGAGSMLAHFFSLFPNILNGISIPVLKNAPLAEATLSGGRWPTMIFSHGLGGSRNAYSHICGSLASHGIVVLAPDHRDGSQPVAFMRETRNTKPGRAEYQFMKHAPCKETFQGRDEQLKIRIWEECLILEAAHMIDDGSQFEELHSEADVESPVKQVLMGFKGRLGIQEPGSVAFAGHSFGGTTTVQLVKSVYYLPNTPSPLFTLNPDALQAPAILHQVTARTPCLLLDPWAMPWGSPATSELAAKPMPCFSGDTPAPSDPDAFIAVLSVPFFNWRSNLESLKDILRDPRPDSTDHPHIFYPQSSAHLSQSDFAILFPTLTRHLAGDTNPTRTLDLNLCGCLEILRRASGRWTTLAAKGPADGDRLDEVFASLALDGHTEGEAGSQPVQTTAGQRSGDARILAKEAGAVRGWVAVSFTEPDDEDDDRDAVATKTDDVAATTDMAGDDQKEVLGAEAEAKGAGIEGPGSVRPVQQRQRSARNGMRLVMKRAGSSGRIKGLRDLRDAAATASQGHGRRIGKTIMAAGRPA